MARRLAMRLSPTTRWSCSATPTAASARPTRWVHLDVGRRWRRIAAWVVVQEHHRAGLEQHRLSRHLPRIERRVVDDAAAQHLIADQAGCAHPGTGRAPPRPDDSASSPGHRHAPRPGHRTGRARGSAPPPPSAPAAWAASRRRAAASVMPGTCASCQVPAESTAASEPKLSINAAATGLAARSSALTRSGSKRKQDWSASDPAMLGRRRELTVPGASPKPRPSGAGASPKPSLALICRLKFRSDPPPTVCGQLSPS